MKTALLSKDSQALRSAHDGIVQQGTMLRARVSKDGGGPDED